MCCMFTSILKHEAEEILRQRKLGFSFVRLLPKDTGVRPIVNLRRKKIEIKVSQAKEARQNLMKSTLPQSTGENERAPAIYQ
jgi:telomerase reverse transcriptase